MSNFKLGDKSLNLVAIPAANLKEVTTAGANDAASCLKKFPDQGLVIKNVNCKSDHLLWDEKTKTVYCKVDDSKYKDVYVCPEGYNFRSSDKKCVYGKDKVDYVCPQDHPIYCKDGITGFDNDGVCREPKTIQGCECK